LRAFDHMDNVECVTVQVRVSHSRGGGDADGPLVDEDAYFVGMRMVMESRGAGAGAALSEGAAIIA
jgi:hypothetical protein